MSTNPFGNPDPLGNSNPYQSGGAPGYGYGYAPPPQGPSGLAIASLNGGIMGIVSTCCCGVFGIPLPLIALVTGGIALANPNAQGKGMAIAGVILGSLSLLFAVVVLVIMLTNPDFGQQFQIRPVQNP